MRKTGNSYIRKLNRRGAKVCCESNAATSLINLGMDLDNSEEHF